MADQRQDTYNNKARIVAAGVSSRLGELRLNATCTHVQVNPEAQSMALAFVLGDGTTIRAFEARTGDIAAAAGAAGCVTYRMGSHVIADLHWRKGEAVRPRPTYDVLARHAVEPMQFIIGTSNGAPVRRKFGDAMPHMAIVAPTRYGKSSLAACAILTLLRSTPQARVILCDPDLRNPRTPALINGIRGNLLAPPAVSPDEIDRALMSLSESITKPRGYPVFLVVDELPSVLASKDARKAIENIVSRGAKNGVHCLFISQQWGEGNITGNWLTGISVVAGYSGHAGTAWQWLGQRDSGAENLSQREFVIRAKDGFVFVDAPDMSWMGDNRSTQAHVPQADIVIETLAPAQIPKQIELSLRDKPAKEKVRILMELGVPKSTITEVVFGSRTPSARKVYEAIAADLNAEAAAGTG